MIFAGTPAFAAGILTFLLEKNISISAVYTQPDRPAGRGLKMHESEVKQVAKKFGLPLYQDETLKTEAAQTTLRALKPKLMIVAAYGLILPKPVLAIPELGCINVHASLLPRWRGAAPITRAILAGDTESGISLMQMDAGLDTGAVFAEEACPITEQDTSESLEKKLTQIGATLLAKNLPAVLAKEIILQPQPETGTTYAHKLKKQEACLNLNESAAVLERQVRAFFPWPIAYIQLPDGMYRIYEAEAKSLLHRAEPGTILSRTHSLDLATAEGVLSIKTIQAPGSKPMPIAAFLNGKGRGMQVGQILSWSSTI